MPFYVGERYVPNGDKQIAMEQADRVRSAVAESPAELAVRLLSITFVPNEEWVFDVFEAGAPQDVERVYAHGQIAFERVTIAVHLSANE